MDVNPLFYEIYNEPKSIIALQGGSSSSKTYSTLQVLNQWSTESRVRNTVAGMTVPHLKNGAYADFQEILFNNPEMERYIIDHHETDRKYTYNTGSYIQFSAFDTELKGRGPRRDNLFVNEANGFSYEICFQLMMRTKGKKIFDWNPSAKYWIHEKFLDNPKQRDRVRLIISDHRYNGFLTAEQHEEIESLRFTDWELFRVYGRGLTGKITGLIYPTFNIIDAMPPHVPTVLGLDFGFAHKMALVEVGHEPKRLYWNELLYMSGLTIADLIEKMGDMGIPKSKRLYCDHAAADKIEDLRRAGYNALPAEKDVKNGIDYCKRHSIYVTKDSVGLRNEQPSYKWKVIKTPDGGTVESEEPVKFRDDAMDAGRYGSYSNRKNTGYIIATASDAPTQADSWLDELENMN